MKAASISAGRSECDVCVPMVDKVVDGSWKKEDSNNSQLQSKGFYTLWHLVIPKKVLYHCSVFLVFKRMCTLISTNYEL